MATGVPKGNRRPCSGEVAVRNVFSTVTGNFMERRQVLPGSPPPPPIIGSRFFTDGDLSLSGDRRHRSRTGNYGQVHPPISPFYLFRAGLVGNAESEPELETEWSKIGNIMKIFTLCLV